MGIIACNKSDRHKFACILLQVKGPYTQVCCWLYLGDWIGTMICRPLSRRPGTDYLFVLYKSSINSKFGEGIRYLCCSASPTVHLLIV